MCVGGIGGGDCDRTALPAGRQTSPDVSIHTLDHGKTPPQHFEKSVCSAWGGGHLAGGLVGMRGSRTRVGGGPSRRQRGPAEQHRGADRPTYRRPTGAAAGHTRRCWLIAAGHKADAPHPPAAQRLGRVQVPLMAQNRGRDHRIERPTPSTICECYRNSPLVIKSISILRGAFSSNASRSTSGFCILPQKTTIQLFATPRAAGSEEPS